MTLGVSSLRWPSLGFHWPMLTYHGPIIFFTFINDLLNKIRSTVHLFADDCVLYRSIRLLNTRLSYSAKFVADHNSHSMTVRGIIHTNKSLLFIYLHQMFSPQNIKEAPVWDLGCVGVVKSLFFTNMAISHISLKEMMSRTEYK